MYHVRTEDKNHALERLRWVKLQSNGVYVICDEAEGQGIILDGEIYHVEGRSPIDKPTVRLMWQDDVAALAEENAMLRGCIMELAEMLCGGEE